MHAQRNNGVPPITGTKTIQTVEKEEDGELSTKSLSSYSDENDDEDRGGGPSVNVAQVGIFKNVLLFVLPLFYKCRSRRHISYLVCG